MPVDLEFYILNTPPSLWRNEWTNKQTEHLEDVNLKE